MNDTAPGGMTEDAALSAAYDRLTADEPITDELVTLSEPADTMAGQDTQAGEDTQPAEVVSEPVAELPPGLSGDFKGVWAKIDPEAQQVIIKTQNQLSAKLANAGRQVQGIAPIRDVLVSAVNDLPQLRDMRPEQVAAEVMELAKINAAFRERPVETLLGYADKHGLRDQLKAALTGQPVGVQQQPSSLLAKISELEQKLAQATNPEYIHQQISTITAQERVYGDVTAFASTAEHWEELEPHIPAFIPAAQAALGEGASHKDVLNRAYEMTVQAFKPAVAVNGSPAPKPADPERARAAMLAKSTNPPGRIASAAVALNEDEALSAAYDRLMRK